MLIVPPSKAIQLLGYADVLEVEAKDVGLLEAIKVAIARDMQTVAF